MPNTFWSAAMRTVLVGKNHTNDQMNSLSHTQYKSNKASQQRSNKPDKKQKWLTFNSIEEVIQYIN